MSGNDLLVVGLLILAGFFVGGVISFARARRWIPMAVLVILTVLAVAGAVLRLIPA